VFDNQVPPRWREDLLALIGECRRLDWLLLTKQPQNIIKMLPADWGDGYRNVWLGVTAENQMYFDQRWKHLQNIPAVIKFNFLRTGTRAIAVAETQPFAELANIGR
jgi:protein gp37